MRHLTMVWGEPDDADERILLVSYRTWCLTEALHLPEDKDDGSADKHGNLAADLVRDVTERWFVLASCHILTTVGHPWTRGALQWAPVLRRAGHRRTYQLSNALAPGGGCGWVLDGHSQSPWLLPRGPHNRFEHQCTLSRGTCRLGLKSLIGCPHGASCEPARSLPRTLCHGPVQRTR